MSSASLLFADGARPRAADIRQLAQSANGLAVSLDTSEEGGQEEGWLELLASGLAFDVTGLEPQKPDSLPELAYRYGIDGSLDPSRLQAVTVVPGPHLSAGGDMIPVVRTLATIVSQLAGLDGVEAVAWHPARSLCDVGYFRSGVRRWIEGGPFPGLGLTSLAADENGGLTTVGLTQLIGQELRLHPDIATEPVEAAKLSVRLINWLVEYGRLQENQMLTGPSGEALMLEPVENFGIVEVWRGSH
ncbi:hypothetical protein [Aurantiacibacter gangjinensis]|uniref:Uncharacterized protein n=1 Tax=Aurantiacibacter gangjinensis TaxID=502682 RepID=A0A0G9MTZ7_9SPHN|nr:hypothetical protein [Aurantiacibacter gangjinensis]APE28620.1 hypothetical protein BMF35_a1791 [Aurantiacibacter gangjinensis]KLE32803.1 hypothetical protein AAW01_01855 [Aurantiacibacter gangjinensis]